MSEPDPQTVALPSWVWRRSWAESAPLWLTRCMMLAGCLFLIFAAMIALAAWLLPTGHPMLSLTALPFAIIGLTMIRPWFDLLRALHRNQDSPRPDAFPDAQASDHDAWQTPGTPNSQPATTADTDDPAPHAATPLTDPGQWVIVAAAAAMVAFALPFVTLPGTGRTPIGWALTFFLVMGATGMSGFAWIILRRLRLARRLRVWFSPYPLTPHSRLQLILRPASLLAPPADQPSDDQSRSPAWRIILHCVDEWWFDTPDESSPVFTVRYAHRFDPARALPPQIAGLSDCLAFELDLPAPDQLIPRPPVAPFPHPSPEQPNPGDSDPPQKPDQDFSSLKPDWILELIPPHASANPEERFWFRLPAIQPDPPPS